MTTRLITDISRKFKRPKSTSRDGVIRMSKKSSHNIDLCLTDIAFSSNTLDKAEFDLAKRLLTHANKENKTTTSILDTAESNDILGPAIISP